MHIGINAQLLSFGQNYRNGGVSRYIRYLLTELARQPGDHEYTVFVNGQDVIERLAQHPHITYVSAPWPESRPATRVAWEQFTLPTLIKQKRIDVLHSPVNVLPEWLPRSCATVVTLHDLAFLRFPNVLTRAKRIYHRTFTVRSMQRATMIITVSDSTQQDAHTLVGIPFEHMHTVYPCISERFSNVFEMGQVDAFRERQGLSEGFLLFLGTLEPRKNITALIDAYARLRQEHNVREKLVLAGGKGWLYDAIFQKVQQLGLESEVIFPGYVSDEEQVMWYQAASVFVYPSLYEGFGFPVAEALACGVPVVTSNVSSLPEAGAQIALCVNPHNVETLAEALYQALTDQTFREKCQTQAPAVAQRFSARAMAEQTIAVYEQAAALHASQRRSQPRMSFVR
ncbi:MAG TPA: glycosyltransferase family 1 protein [Ktedonobacteraceae bacterium]|nr:glycosyltransferase family 1 protein [Ktedonobacteraceae bacterium]